MKCYADDILVIRPGDSCMFTNYIIVIDRLPDISRTWRCTKCAQTFCLIYKRCVYWQCITDMWFRAFYFEDLGRLLIEDIYRLKCMVAVATKLVYYYY